MHRLSSSFILGYHGCTKNVATSLLSGTAFRPSQNEYDWLGHGIYFWESNPARGLEFIREAYERRHGVPAASDALSVVGTVIDLGLCLDLMSSSGIRALQAVHQSLVKLLQLAGKPVPSNRGGTDLLMRDLDCAVINHLHELRERTGSPAFDAVRGVFIEGKPISEGAGFREKTHIQVCVRNPSCIKGVFRVPTAHLEP